MDVLDGSKKLFADNLYTNEILLRVFMAKVKSDSHYTII